MGTVKKEKRPLPIFEGKAVFVINLITQVCVIVAQMVISLVLTPIVLDKMGAEAYGFVGLVNNFVSYAAIVTTALNSLAGRFITLAHHEGDKDAAESYYSSVFFANCILAALVLAASVILAVNIESVVFVSSELVTDLQIMILLAFLNCALSLVVVVFGIAAFIKNQLYLNSVAQLISSVVRATLLCALFAFVSPHMWYYGIAAVVASVIFLVVQVLTARRVAPEYHISLNRFSLARVKEVLKSGSWSSVESVNKLLLTGLDLWISNLFVGAYQMGIFSVSKTVPNALVSMSGSFSNLFYPKCAELYAKKEKVALTAHFSLAMKFTAGVMTVPLVGLIVYGVHFFELWLPGRGAEEIILIQTLSVLTVVSLISSSLVEPLYYANSLANKIKGSVLITLLFGILVVTVELLLLFFSKINGLLVIASVSSIVMSVRHCVVQPFYAAKVLNVSVAPFFKTMARELMGFTVVFISFLLLSNVLCFTSWLLFAASCAFSAVVGYIELTIVLLSSEERKALVCKLFKKGRTDEQNG